MHAMRSVHPFTPLSFSLPHVQVKFDVEVTDFRWSPNGNYIINSTAKGNIEVIDSQDYLNVANQLYLGKYKYNVGVPCTSCLPVRDESLDISKKVAVLRELGDDAGAELPQKFL